MNTNFEFKHWRKLTVSGDSPFVRQGHAMAVVENRAYLFGGSALSDNSSNIFYDDLYCITLSDLKWESIKPSGDLPSGREGHSLNVVNTDLYLMGGVESEDIPCASDKCYILNTDSQSWLMKTMTGTLPQAQSSTCVSTKDGRIISFGGVLNGKACNDTHVMDSATLVWTCPNTTGSKPLSRCDHGCVVMENKMYVFGGSGGESLWFNDLSFLDLVTYEWVVLNSIDQAPCPRDYPSLLSMNTNMLVVFGGFTGFDGQDRCLCDTHFCSGDSSSSWKLVDDVQPPPSRYGHAAFVHNNKIYIQGGQSNERMFNDLWVLEFKTQDTSFSPTIPPQRNYSTSTPIPAPRKKLPPLTTAEFVTKERGLDELKSQYLGQVSVLFDTLSQKFQELDEMASKLDAERKQFEQEREELHTTYDKQQEDMQYLLECHKQDNEEWVLTMRLENDKERKEIAEEKAMLAQERKDFENERDKFNQKSNKLDEIMKQVQGLK